MAQADRGIANRGPLECWHKFTDRLLRPIPVVPARKNFGSLWFDVGSLWLGRSLLGRPRHPQLGLFVRGPDRRRHFTAALTRRLCKMWCAQAVLLRAWAAMVAITESHAEPTRKGCPIMMHAAGLAGRISQADHQQDQETGETGPKAQAMKSRPETNPTLEI